MFDVSFSELLLIGIVALIVIGPERLPKVARTVGHLVGRAQRYVSDVKSDIRREMEANEIGNLKDEMQEAASTIKASFSETEQNLRKSVDEVHATVQQTSDALNDTTRTIAKDTMSVENRPAPATPEAGSPISADDAPGPQSAADLDPLTLPLPGLEPPASTHAGKSPGATDTPARSDAPSSNEAST